MNYNIFFPEHTVPLHAMLINCGRGTVVSHDYYWDGTRRGGREMQIWQYTVSGRGALRAGGRVHSLTRGYALFVQVPGDHAYYLPEDSETWEILYVTFFGREASRLAREVRERHGEVLKLPPTARSLRLAEEIHNRCEHGMLTDKYQSSRLAYEFPLALLEDLEAGPGRLSPAGRLLRRVYDYSIEHLARPIDIGELARHCGYSRSHFTRVFTRAQQMTPGEFINDLRLTYALRLLQTEQLAVKEIAGRCGFADPSYFCRVFRRRYGTSPERYRLTSGQPGVIL